MYDLIIRVLRPSLIRRSVNLVSAVRIEGSNFNQWLSVIEMQTNFFLYLVGAKPGMSVFNSIKQLLCAKWSYLGLNTSNTLKNDTQARSIRGGLKGILSPYQDFQDFGFVFKCLFIFFLGQDCLMSLPLSLSAVEELLGCVIKSM